MAICRGGVGFGGKVITSISKIIEIVSEERGGRRNKFWAHDFPIL